MEEHNTDSEEKETNKARHREGEIERGRRIKRKGRAGMCEEKRWREYIYLSPDGSVLGVHLWRNEISG